MSYNTNDPRPWFGELALWSSKPRAATAVCDEPTKVLVVRSAHFATFLETIPTFSNMFATSANGYAVLNVMMQQQEEINNAAVAARDVINTRTGNVMASLLDRKTGIDARDFEPEEHRLLSITAAKWEALTRGLLQKAGQPASERRRVSLTGP